MCHLMSAFQKAHVLIGDKTKGYIAKFEGTTGKISSLFVTSPPEMQTSDDTSHLLCMYVQVLGVDFIMHTTCNCTQSLLYIE